MPSLIEYRTRRLLDRARNHARRLTFRPEHFLCVYAIMHDEAHILREWLDFHLDQGFDHVFLLDHRSTDRYDDILGAAAYQGCVTLRRTDNARFNNDDLRVFEAGFALDRSEWCLVADLDEFTYARTPGGGQGAAALGSLPAILRALPDDVAQVAVPWVMFGTGGNRAQPPSVVHGCLMSEDLRVRAALSDRDDPWYVKSIIRPDRLSKMHAHTHEVRGRTVLPMARGLYDLPGPNFVPNAMAAQAHDMLVLQNHYVFQSEERFIRKTQRRFFGRDMYEGTRSYDVGRLAREDPGYNAVPNDELSRLLRARER
jgi:hypothetical protein